MAIDTLKARLAAFALAAIAMLCAAGGAYAIEPIKISRDNVALDLSRAVQIYQNQGQNFQVSTAPGPDRCAPATLTRLTRRRSTGAPTVRAPARSRAPPAAFRSTASCPIDAHTA